MNVILKQNVDGVGEEGSIVTVKDGYARNFIIARNLGIRASAANMKVYEEEKKQIAVREVKIRKNAEETAKALNKLSLTIAVKTGEEDKVFGSVTGAKIADLIKEQGFSIGKKQVLLDEPLKTLGVFTVQVKVFGDVEAGVKIWIVKE